VSGRQHARGGSWAIAWTLGAALALAGLSFHLERASGASPNHPSEPTTPVVVAAVERRDIPVELTGIGTVEAYYQVTVKPRINGQITGLDFTEGTPVRPGQVLAKLDDRLLAAQVQQARAARLRDQASLAEAVKKLARATRLALQGYVSRDDLDTLRSQAAVLRASVAFDQAAVKTAQVELDYTVIRAPIRGITGIRLIDPGNVISTSDPGIVVITQITPITVVFSLPADELAALPMGANSQALPVVAFSRDDRMKIASGELALTDNRIDPTTNTVRLKAIFQNRRELLKPGEFVNAHLLLSVQHSALTLPARAIQFSDRGAFVWLLRSDSTVEQRPITTGASSGRFVAITHGLTAGDRVVVTGQYGLRTGSLVAVQDASQALPTAGASVLDVP
jgi:multidrug efflux system membrane fusion protein